MVHSRRLAPPRQPTEGQGQPRPCVSGRARVLNQDARPTCLSSLRHGPDAVRDPFQHYLGCIEISERAGFLDKDNDYWTKQKEIEIHKLMGANRVQNMKDVTDSMNTEAEARVKKCIDALAIAIEAQYKRTRVLRQALEKEASTTSKGPPSDSEPNPEDFVGCIRSSGKRWRDSLIDNKEHREGIEKIRKWRKSKRRHIDSPPPASGAATDQLRGEPGRDEVQQIVKNLRGSGSMDEIADYDLERDVNAYLVQYTRDPVTDENTDGENANPQSLAPPDTSLWPIDEMLTDHRFKGTFPDQRLSMSLLLGKCEDSSDIMFQGHYPNRVRYLHIPSNNMEWVEQVIAAYYSDPPFETSYMDSPVRTRTQMLLRPEFWRGQQHGTRSGAVHARYMSPLCERISSAVDEIEDNPKNIVLFMPYMHWETDRMRNTIARMIDTESEQQRQRQEAKELEDKEARINFRRPVGTNGRQLKHPGKDPNDPRSGASKKRPARSWSDIMRDPRVARVTSDGIKVEENGRLRIDEKISKTRPLGQYLIDAARLFEAMSTFRDRQMLKKYLYNDPPLHPRRTLDQSHYWTLRSTNARDRDQVVYRGTSINQEFAHKLHEVPVKGPKKTSIWHADDEKTQAEEHLEEIIEEKPSSAVRWWPFARKERKQQCQWQWTRHWARTDTHGCEHCTSDIKKISKLIMVDQLWMWVLDERTIITSFPRRYGHNKYDLQGIHRSIRQRLRNARKNQIRSVYDLALIILDECSNTFFDRTKTQGNQPQVMDIFSEAIGNVTNQHTISFQHVWHWTQKAADVYRTKSKHNDTSDLHVPLLDIHPEGKLQREVKDILDELDIMIDITQRQSELIKRFCKHVEDILDPERLWRSGSSDPLSPTNYGDLNGDLGPVLAGKMAEKSKRKEQLIWFHMQSQDLICEVNDRISELKGLREGAKSTAQSVNDLLSLKQQQASVVQAWESVNQAEEAVRQGRSIMMFTIITIIFLPLSFMSSVFGMNNLEFGADPDKTSWTLHQQFRYMFPISLGVILISLILAFSKFLRAIIWSGYTYITTLVVVKSGLYGVWLEYNENWMSASLMQTTERKVLQLKEDVRKARRRRKGSEYAKKREKKLQAKVEEGGRKAKQHVLPENGHTGVESGGSNGKVEPQGSNGKTGVHRPRNGRLQLRPQGPEANGRPGGSGGDQRGVGGQVVLVGNDGNV